MWGALGVLLSGYFGGIWGLTGVTDWDGLLVLRGQTKTRKPGGIVLWQVDRAPGSLLHRGALNAKRCPWLKLVFLYWIHTAVAAVLTSSKTQIFLLSSECVYIWSHVEAYCSEWPEWAVERAERWTSSSSKRPSHMEKRLILTQKRWQSTWVGCGGDGGGAREKALRLTAAQLFINRRSFSTRQRETSSIFPTCRFIQAQKQTKPPTSVSRILASYLVLILTKRS